MKVRMFSAVLMLFEQEDTVINLIKGELIINLFFKVFLKLFFILKNIKLIFVDISSLFWYFNIKNKKKHHLIYF